MIETFGKAMFDRNEVKDHFNHIAGSYDGYKEQNSHYYRELKALIREQVGTDRLGKVFEIGCGTGNLLVEIPGRFLLGGDLSLEMVRKARNKWADRGDVQFITMAAEELPVKPVFDFILIVDLLEHVPDPGEVFMELRYCAGQSAKILVIAANPLWAPVLHFAEQRKLKMPEGPHRWPSLKELKQLSRASGYAIQESGYRYLFPFPMGKIGAWINHITCRIPFVNRLCLIQYLVLYAE